MRIVSLLMIAVTASAMALGACGGATSGSVGSAGDGTGGEPPPGAATTPPTTDQPPNAEDAPKLAGASCPNPSSVLVLSGGVLARPAGSALRLQLVYQGSTIGVTSARGVDMILPPADGPFAAGKVAGYWVETRSAAGTTYQRLVQDPTAQEAPGAPSGGGFSNSTLDRCAAKLILADVPNDASTSEVVVYGSPYGTSDGAIELARFTLK
jgi:hypothetical protein